MADSNVSTNLSRGDTDWRTTIQPALDQNLMGQVLDKTNVLKAWGRVKSNQGAPGSDGMTLADFPTYAREHWPSICQP